MENSTLLSLLKSLNDDEFNEFEDFIKSPFFNKNRRILDLFGILKRHYPHFEDKAIISKESVFDKLYPDKKYNYGVMNNLVYELNKLGEKFLEYKRYSKFKVDRQIYVMSELFNRGLRLSLERNIRTTEKILDEQSKNDGYFYDRLNFDTLKNNYFVRYESKTEKFNFAEHSNQWLISYFLIKFFRINYNNLIQKYNFDVFGDIDFIEELLEFVRKNKFAFEPVIEIYYNMFMTQFRSEERIYYTKLWQLVRKNSGLLSNTEIFNLYICLCNYCLKKITTGDKSYNDDLFALYCEMLKMGLFNYEDKGYIAPRLFRNIVQASVNKKEFKWALKFINDYSIRLEPAVRENEMRLSMAYYYLSNKDYTNSLAELSKVRFEALIDKPHFYLMQCKLNYELENLDALENNIDSFRHFISYDKFISKEIKQLFSGFIRIIVSLVKFKLKDHADKSFRIQKLKEKLHSENIIEKDWLLEKIDCI
jgi:hypothetical protein